MIRAPAFCAVAMLAGCSTVPLGSLLPLSRIDIRTTNLGVLRVALQMPDVLKPRPNGVKLDVVTKVRGEPDRWASFHLVETAMGSDRPGMAKAARKGFTTHLYRLSPADIARLEALRSAMAGKLKQGKSASLGFGIATKEFCRLGALPSGPLLTTTHIWTSETGRYVVASEDMDLRKQRDIASQLPQIAPC